MTNNLKSTKHPTEVVLLINKKMKFFQDVIQRTILHVARNKMYDILAISDMNTCISVLNDLSNKIKEFMQKMDSVTTDTLINELQNINNELSSILKNYGTELLEDLLLVCFGSTTSYYYENEYDKYDLLKKYFHPTGYKVANIKKSDTVEQGDEPNVNEKTKNLDCYDIFLSVKQFHMKVYGIKVFFYNSSCKKNLMIYGILDDIILNFLENDYLSNKVVQIKSNIPNDLEFQSEAFENFLSSLTLKDHLIMSTNDVYNKYMGLSSNVNSLKQRPISALIKEFIQCDLYAKRNTLIQLLIKTSKQYDNYYIAYLLYDLLSNDSNGNVDTQEQTILFDSFPWSIKKFFRDAMKRTIQYTNELSNFDMNKIPLEQQICLLKTGDSVKEKAMIKLKEVKAKSEDSGSKARQYLDGLLKIPFGIYRKEPVLNVMQEVKRRFIELLKNKDIKTKMGINDENVKNSYTSIEIIKYLNKYTSLLNKANTCHLKSYSKIKKEIMEGTKKVLLIKVENINLFIEKEKLTIPPLVCDSKNKSEIKNAISLFFDVYVDKYPNSLLQLAELAQLEYKCTSNQEYDHDKNITINSLNKNLVSIKNYIADVKITLDKAVYGHDKAKKQIERIIGQWINGEQDGYCFGFEGPPGCGKTSLAKRGLANCLKDENGASRPFAMIQMGGDSNGSSLHGHNYTYVGSTWGSIVQILMDKKCMNPIIFIDELDKISKTEHGREIIGILTHLLDPTQNDCFQDKYFTGIDLDLSKALFVLSYNDVDAIDKVLLDRIHRIKFSHLSIEEKLVITNSHILPEVYKKMGLEGIIKIHDDALKFIIEEYTLEPGVRKLKEILFELIGDINLNTLKETEYKGDLPICIAREEIRTKYLKGKTEIKYKKIHEENKVGHINGMWANAMGQGGIIPIQAKYYPADKFLNLKLTGMQGDVMKESMNVALTLAWELTTVERKKEVRKELLLILSGVHVHCPEGSIPKDGPSAGAAITTAIYSLFNNKKISNSVAITGEISLDGTITEIGGLDLKLLGGIKAGVKRFIFPRENEKDFDSFMEKYKDSELIFGVEFHSVSKIEELFDFVFEN